MTARDDLQRAVERMADTLPLLGAFHGKDELWGAPDARLRTADAMTSRWEAGDDLLKLTDDYGVWSDVVTMRVVAAYLSLLLNLRASRIPEKDWGRVVTEMWPGEETG